MVRHPGIFILTPAQSAPGQKKKKPPRTSEASESTGLAAAMRAQDTAENREACRQRSDACLPYRHRHRAQQYGPRILQGSLSLSGKTFSGHLAMCEESGRARFHFGSKFSS